MDADGAASHCSSNPASHRLAGPPRVADNVVEIDGRFVAIEAKWVNDWATSLRNPASAIGKLPWAVKEQATMREQARKYSAYFDEVIYHTNSQELIDYYQQVFEDAGLDNIRFILTEE